MQIDDIRFLFAYDRWATRKVLAAAGPLGEAQCPAGEPIGDPAGRAKELIEHHEQRLEQTVALLDGDPRTAYDVSLRLFPEPLSPALRRFALAETRAHLEYLVLRDGARRVDDELVEYQQL